MPLEPGALLHERYRIEGILAQGGFGAVYQATDENLGLSCAVKENLSVSEASGRQFRREARFLATLRHPHLPRVTNHFISEGRQYLVMDLVEGDDLAQRRERQARLGEREVLRWTQQICEALTYLHEQDPPVIHRDVKPANIKITPAGKAVLVDFGIAKAATAGQTTSTGAKGITPGYAPPEQYDLGHTETRTDVYALGATLYSLLTGLRPPDSVERLIGIARLIPPEAIRPDLSPHVAAAIRKAMQVRARDRFLSIAEFASALAEPSFRFEPDTESAPEAVAPPAAPSPRERLGAFAASAAQGLRRGLPSMAGLAALMIALAVIFLGPGSIMDALGVGGLGISLPELGSSGPLVAASFEREVPTVSPSATAVLETPGPTPVSLPTPTPSPAVVSIGNAGAWRLHAQWTKGDPSVPFALNAEGDALALVDRQGVDTFDLITGDRVRELQGFIIGRRPSSIAHLGDSLLVQFDDEILRYDLATGNLRERIRVPGRDLVVSADGSMLAIRQDYVRVISLRTGELHATLGEKNTQQHYALSPDGTLFALSNKSNVELYDSRSGEMLATLAGHGEPTQALAFSPDGAYLISASGDVWKIPGGERVAIFDSSTDRIAVSPNSQVIVGDDGSIWALETGEQLGRMPVETEGSRRMLFTPDGRFLIRHLRSGTVQLWAVDPYVSAARADEPAPATLSIGERITPYNISRLGLSEQFGDSSMRQLILSPDWRTAATWDASRITVLSLISGEVLQTIRISGRILDVTYLGSEFITVVNAFRQLERWEITTGRQKQVYDMQGHTILGSQAGNFFAVQEKYIQVVDPLSGARVFNLGSAVMLADKYAEVPGYEPDAASESGIPFQDFAFSPDGSVLAITSGSGVGLWDLGQGGRVAHLIGHGPQTHGLTFTPDGSRLLSSSGDIWEVETGERIADFDTEAAALAISPSGELVAGSDGSLWDGADGQYLGNLDFRATALWFTPNDRQLVILTPSSGVAIYGIQPKAARAARPSAGAQAAKLVELNRSAAPHISLLGWWGVDPLLQARNERDRAEPLASNYGQHAYERIALASDGQTIIGLDAQGVDFLDPASGQLVDRYRIFLNPESVKEIAALGDHLLLLKPRAGVERWDLASGELVQRYPLAGSDLMSSPSGGRFALRQGNRLQVVDAVSGELQAQITLTPGAQCFAFSPDGSALAVVRGSVAELWALESATRIRILHSHVGQVRGLAFSPDGQHLFAASGDRWLVSTGERMAGFDSSASQIVIAAPENLIVGDDGALREAAAGLRVATLIDLRFSAAQWLITQDGRMIVARAGDGRVLVLGVRSGTSRRVYDLGPSAITAGQVPVLELSSHLGRGRLQDAVWSPDERWLAVNSSQTAEIFNAEDVSPVLSLLDARILAFDSGGRALVGGGQPLQLVDPLSGRVIRDFGLSGITQATFSPDGDTLAIAGLVSPAGDEDGLAILTLDDGSLRILDAGRGDLGAPLGLEFTPDAGVLVASYAGTITLWEVESGRELRQAIRGNIKPASVSPDGRHLVYLTHRFVVEDLESGGRYRTINADGTPFFATGIDHPALRPVDYNFTPSGRLLVFYRQLNRRTLVEELALVEWDVHAQPVRASVKLEGLLSLSNLDGAFLEHYSNERPQRIPAFKLSPRGAMFVGLTGDGVARVWNANDGVRRGASLSDLEDLMALDPAGTLVAVPNAQGAIEIFNLLSGDRAQTLSGSWSPVWLGYSSPKVLMLVEADGSVRLLDATSGALLDRFALQAFSGAQYFSLERAGRMYAHLRRSGGQNALQIFSLNPDRPLMDLGLYPLPHGPAFSPDGRTLAMVWRDRVELWDLASGSVVGELGGLGPRIGELTYTPDGLRLIAATGEIWDLARGELAAQFETSDPSMTIRTNGHIVVGQDGSVWEVRTGASLGTLPGLRGEAVDFVFTPGGERLLWQAAGGVIEVWEVTP